MKKEDKYCYIKPLALFPYIFWLFYLFERGFDWISGMLGFVLICIGIAVYVMVKE